MVDNGLGVRIVVLFLWDGSSIRVGMFKLVVELEGSEFVRVELELRLILIISGGRYYFGVLIVFKGNNIKRRWARRGSS